MRTLAFLLVALALGAAPAAAQNQPPLGDVLDRVAELWARGDAGAIAGLTSERGVVYDMFAGTGSMALACIKTGRYYVGCDPDADVHTWSTQRIGRAWAAYDRGEMAAEQAGLRRALAEQLGGFSFLLPPNNFPDAAKRGIKKLHPTDATQNLGVFLAGPQEEPYLSIVDYTEVIGFQDAPLGMGVRTDVERKTGNLMGPLVFGNFTTEEKFVETAKANDEPTEFSRNPGAFALQTPYEHVVCILADNCPARYVNDAKGVPGAKPNIQFLQHTDPRQLFFDPMLGLHLLLQAQAVCDIGAGEQLFVSYGDLFWEEGGPINRKDIDEVALVDPGYGAATPDSDDEILLIPTPGRKPKNCITLSKIPQ